MMWSGSDLQCAAGWFAMGEVAGMRISTSKPDTLAGKGWIRDKLLPQVGGIKYLKVLFTSRWRVRFTLLYRPIVVK